MIMRKNKSHLTGVPRMPCELEERLLAGKRTVMGVVRLYTRSGRVVPLQ
jgi:hypothetical protein